MINPIPVMESSVLDALAQGRAMSITEIARATGMHHVQAGAVVRGMASRHAVVVKKIGLARVVMLP